MDGNYKDKTVSPVKMFKSASPKPATNGATRSTAALMTKSGSIKVPSLPTAKSTLVKAAPVMPTITKATKPSAVTTPAKSVRATGVKPDISSPAKTVIATPPKPAVCTSTTPPTAAKSKEATSVRAAVITQGNSSEKDGRPDVEENSAIQADPLNRSDMSNVLFVGNVDARFTTIAELKNLFPGCVNVRLFGTQRHGCAFVIFNTEEEVVHIVNNRSTIVLHHNTLSLDYPDSSQASPARDSGGLKVSVQFTMDMFKDTALLEHFAKSCKLMEMQIQGDAGKKKSVNVSILYTGDEYKIDVDALQELKIRGKPLDSFSVCGIPQSGPAEKQVHVQVVVKNIPDDTADEVIKGLFAEATKVTIPKPKGLDGKNKGCAMLTFSYESDARQCLKRNKGVAIEGKTLIFESKITEVSPEPSVAKSVGPSTVNVSSPAGKRPAPSVPVIRNMAIKRPRIEPHTPAEKQVQVVVENIPDDTADEVIKGLFAEASKVTIPKPKGLDGKNKGCAMLTFSYESDARQCLKRNKGVAIEGRTLIFKSKITEVSPEPCVPKSVAPSTVKVKIPAVKLPESSASVIRNMAVKRPRIEPRGPVAPMRVRGASHPRGSIGRFGPRQGPVRQSPFLIQQRVMERERARIAHEQMEHHEMDQQQEVEHQQEIKPMKHRQIEGQHQRERQHEMVRQQEDEKREREERELARQCDLERQAVERRRREMVKQQEVEKQRELERKSQMEKEEIQRKQKMQRQAAEMQKSRPIIPDSMAVKMRQMEARLTARIVAQTKIGSINNMSTRQPQSGHGGNTMEGRDRLNIGHSASDRQQPATGDRRPSQGSGTRAAGRVSVERPRYKEDDHYSPPQYSAGQRDSGGEKSYANPQYRAGQRDSGGERSYANPQYNTGQRDSDGERSYANPQYSAGQRDSGGERSYANPQYSAGQRDSDGERSYAIPQYRAGQKDSDGESSYANPQYSAGQRDSSGERSYANPRYSAGQRDSGGERRYANPQYSAGQRDNGDERSYANPEYSAGWIDSGGERSYANPQHSSGWLDNGGENSYAKPQYSTGQGDSDGARSYEQRPGRFAAFAASNYSTYN